MKLKETFSTTHAERNCFYPGI